MKYVIHYHENEPERITLSAPSVGIKLDRDEARRVIRDAAEFFGVATGIPVQDPPAPAYRPYGGMT